MTKADREADARYQEEIDARDRKIMANMSADAVLYIRNAADMPEEYKLQMAEWLRLRAEDLLANGHNYSFLFTGHFNSDPGSER